jgi:hypothetical protein
LLKKQAVLQGMLRSQTPRALCQQANIFFFPFLLENVEIPTSILPFLDFFSRFVLRFFFRFFFPFLLENVEIPTSILPFLDFFQDFFSDFFFHFY